ncbi:MAG: hypothetical protein KDE48_16575 [Anaerolineales bacterium]|nr:hypothetical protein [Anaerolineales bacterium]
MQSTNLEGRKPGKFILAVVLATTILILIVLQSAASKTAVSQPQNQFPSVLTSLNLAPSASENAVDSTMGNCRYGVASIPPNGAPWISTLGAGWYLSFFAVDHGYDTGNDAEFVYTLRMKNGIFDPPLSEITDELDDNPGALWLVGSEMEVDHPISGDNTFPDDYATAYHTAYDFIKGKDPTAQIGIGGMSMATPGRLQYLDLVWDNYLSTYGTEIPVDVWNVHIYIFAEREWDSITPYHGNIALGTDPLLGKQSPGGDPSRCPLDDVYCLSEHDSLEIIQQQTVAFRQWMKDHGQQDKPFIISELALLYQAGFLDENGQDWTTARVNTYMTGLFDYLNNAQDPALGYPADNNRLVQQWLWYSLNVPVGTTGRPSNLLNDDFASFPAGDVNGLSAVGINFRDIVAAQSLDANLLAGATSGNQTAASSAELTTEFYNNGSMNIAEPFQVTYYADAALTQPIGTTTIDPTIYGCARHTYSATINWSGLSQGEHDYWVKIDGSNDVDESDETDNVTMGTVEITGGFPTETPTPTATVPPTATPSATPSATPLPSSIKNYLPIIPHQ